MVVRMSMAVLAIMMVVGLTSCHSFDSSCYQVCLIPSLSLVVSSEAVVWLLRS